MQPARPKDLDALAEVETIREEQASGEEHHPSRRVLANAVDHLQDTGHVGREIFPQLTASDPWHQQAGNERAPRFGGHAAVERLPRNGPIRIMTNGGDIYDRVVADVFANEKNVAKALTLEGYEKPRS